MRLAEDSSFTGELSKRVAIERQPKGPARGPEEKQEESSCF